MKLSFFFEEKTYYRKHIIYREGDISNEVYIIREGEFQFVKKIPLFEQTKKPTRKILLPKRPHQHKAEVAILSKGEIFGDEEIINDSLRSNTCMCYSLTSSVLLISKNDFMKRITSEDS